MSVHMLCLRMLFFCIVLSSGIPRILRPDVLQTDRQMDAFLNVCVCAVDGMQSSWLTVAQFMDLRSGPNGGH